MWMSADYKREHIEMSTILWDNELLCYVVVVVVRFSIVWTSQRKEKLLILQKRKSLHEKHQQQLNERPELQFEDEEKNENWKIERK